jgi:hypothetical protein
MAQPPRARMRLFVGQRRKNGNIDAAEQTPGKERIPRQGRSVKGGK